MTEIGSCVGESIVLPGMIEGDERGIDMKRWERDT